MSFNSKPNVSLASLTFCNLSFIFGMEVNAIKVKIQNNYF